MDCFLSVHLLLSLIVCAFILIVHVDSLLVLFCMVLLYMYCSCKLMLKISLMGSSGGYQVMDFSSFPRESTRDKSPLENIERFIAIFGFQVHFISTYVDAFLCHIILDSDISVRFHSRGNGHHLYGIAFLC